MDQITLTLDDIERLRDVGYNHDCEFFGSDANLEIRSYSGRGMYGDYCFGIVCSGAGELMRFILIVKEALDDDALDTFLGGPREDSMGYRTIYYWPNVTLDDDAQEFVRDHEDD